MKTQKGFTLVELLVVIAIIALVGVMAAVAVNSARSKQRDATRLSNVRLLQSALEDYFNETNAYPVGELLPLGDVSQSTCLGSDGFAVDCSVAESVFLRVVPETYEDGLDGIVTCGEPSRRAFCYTALQEGESYVIHFELENGLTPVGLQAGVNCATPDGMEAGICSE
ncbi:type II secretion system protein [Candidatus Uhrbacteria bacterium]|nr:type II secretion system protein [Candidatus Uhrbacteria bacterium]